MSRLQEVLDRAFPIFQMGGLSGAMYPADEGEGQGWVLSNEDWEVVAGVIRELIEDPIATVRRGVESGTIKGSVAWKCETHGGDFQEREPDEYAICMSMLYEDAWDALPPPEKCKPVRVLVIPVSDGGSET